MSKKHKTLTREDINLIEANLPFIKQNINKDTAKAVKKLVRLVRSHLFIQEIFPTSKRPQ